MLNRTCLSKLPHLISASRSGLRYLATSNTPYAYPSQPKPTPHQIFHLPIGATQEEVKARYYELVRIHHPDAPSSRALPSELAQSRFHSITEAYDILRGAKAGFGSGYIPGESATQRAAREARNLQAAIWRAKQAKRADLDIGETDDRWKDRLMIGFVILGLIGFVAQSATIRSKALQENLEFVRQKKEERTARRMREFGDSPPHSG